MSSLPFVSSIKFNWISVTNQKVGGPLFVSQIESYLPSSFPYLSIYVLLLGIICNTYTNGVLINFSSLTIISLFLSSIEFYWIRVTNNKVGRTTVRLSNRILYFFFFFIEQVHAWIVSLDSVVVCVYYMMQKGIQHMDELSSLSSCQWILCLCVVCMSKKGENTSTMSSSSSSCSCLVLNWHDSGRFSSVCVCNMIYTEEKIIFDYNEERKEGKKEIV